MLPAAATEFYALQQRVNQTATNEVRRLWGRMGDDFDASWRRYGPAVLAVITEAQLVVAEAATEYVPNVLAETDTPNRPEAEFRPDSLAGVASDGRRLDTLAYTAVIESKTAIGSGATTAQGLDDGASFLELLTKLQVADAARQAVGVMTASRKNLGGSVRVLNLPSCQRCAILAGRWYRWNADFPRHPRCDCVSAPVPSKGYAEAEGFLTEPMDAYRRGEIKDLTQAQIAAIEEGADIGRVVNAYRGMSTTATNRNIKTIRHAVEPVDVLPGVPDLLGFLPPEIRNRRPNLTRLTPEGVYRQAAGDRDEAIRLLRAEGYLT